MRHRSPSSGLAALLSLALVLGMGAVVTVASPPAPAAAATGTLSLDHDATPATVLAGENARIVLEARHAGAPEDIAYNVSFVATLPPGASYVAGSATPASGPGSPGEPRATKVTPNPTDTSTEFWVLEWSNVTDVPAGGTATLGFQLALDPARFPAGSTVEVPSLVLGSDDERMVPTVTLGTTGVSSVANATANASDTAVTRVSPVEITKSEPSPESELLRGLQDQQTTYTLTVRVAQAGALEGVVVRDMLPAPLQFLGCESVSTVDGCALFAGQSVVSSPSGAMTELRWELGSLPAGSTTTIRYTAAAGYQALTETGAFDGTSLRQSPSGTEAVNTATVTGTYGGAVLTAADRAVDASTQHTVQVLDVALAKSADTGSFAGGSTVRYTLDVRVGQYTDASAIVVTDTLPDGVCLYLPAGFAVPAGWPADCAGLDRRPFSGATLLGADVMGDGRTTLTFELPDVPANGTARVTYDAYMRATHADGSPTATGETFTNTAALSATTNPVAGSPETGSRHVTNGSSAVVASDGPTLVKQVWPNASRSPIAGLASCPDVTSPLWSTSAQPVVRLGDLVCFQITLRAHSGVALRDVALRDFVPVGTEYVDADVVDTSSSFAVTQIPGQPAWTIGDTIGSSRYLPAGASATFQVLAQVTDTNPTGKDILGNLAKMRWRDADNRIAAQRTQVDFVVAPAAPLSLTKTVTAASGTSTSQRVGEGEVVTYRLTVRHEGTAADASDHPVSSVELWDALPSGFTCADVVSAVTCAPGTTTSTTGRSVVTTTLQGAALGGDAVLTAGETATFDLQVRIPSPLSIASSHRNDASVVEYTVPTTDGRPGATEAVYRPSDSLADPTDGNAPAANASATVTLPNAVVAKRVSTTSVVEAGNDELTQATIGERVSYVYSIELPAKSSIFHGVLSDALPGGGRLTDLTVHSSAAPGLTTTGFSSGDGETCTPTGTTACVDQTTGRLSLPPVVTNSTASAQTFSVSVSARVANAGANTHASTLVNTATLTSHPSATATTPVTRGTASATVNVVLPAVTLVKAPLNGSNAPVDPLTVGTSQVVTYRLTAAQSSSTRPTAHDAVVVDCLPVGMLPVTPLPAGLTTQDGTGPCAATRKQITWDLGDLAATGQSVVEYQATVPADSAGSSTLVNTATLAASTIEDGANGTTTERSFTTSDTGTVQLASPTGTKTADVTWAVPGQVVTYTLTSRLPANANYYDSAVIDVLPAGVEPDLTNATVTCTGGDATWQATCAGTPVSATYTGTTTTRVVWPLGDLPALTSERVVTITLPATIDPAGSTAAGTSTTNAHGVGWFQTDASRTVTTTTTFDRAPTLGTVSVAVREPLLTVTKTVDDSTPEPGQVFTYSVKVSSATAANRQATAYGITVTDTVPVGVEPLDADGDPVADLGTTASGGTWDATTRRITWTLTSLAASASSTLAVPAMIVDADAVTAATLTNTARVASWSSLAADGRSYGPSTPATVDVTPVYPRVNATKAQTTTNPVTVGQEVSYAVTLTNAGGGTAASVGVTDTLPASWEYVAGSATIQVGSTPAVALADPSGTGTLVWSDVLPSGVSLAPGAEAVLRYVATPTAAAASSAGSAAAHTNTVDVTGVTDRLGGDSYDGGTGSYLGTGGSATARIHAADLSVTKTASTWVAGSSTNTWTVRVTNAGPDPAVGVVVEDVLGTLPDGVSLVSVAGTGFTCDVDAAAGEATCTRGTALASGASATLTVTTSVDSDVAAGTQVANTATVTSATFDPDPDDNEASSTATVTTVADLELVKTGPASVAAGAPATWTVTVTNRGPSVSRATVAAPVVVTDTLPQGVTVTDVSPVGAVCDEPDATELTCRRTTDLASGASFQVQVTGRLDAALVAADGPLVNTAEVVPVTGQGDDTYDDADSTSTAIAHAEDLHVTKAIAQTLVAGSTGSYAIAVRNDGPSLARGVVVTDDLPTGLTFAGGVTSTDDWTCTGTGTTSVTCELDGVLGVGTSAASSFTFDVTVAAGRTGTILNEAVVGSTWQADQDSDDVQTGTTVHADLGITKSHPAGDVRAGDGTTFTIVVTNHGPSDAPGPITVTDTVPAGLPLDGAPTPDGGSCTVGAATSGGARPVTCTLATGLDVDDEWEIEIPVLVPADAAPATITNTATVAGPPTLDEDDDTHANTASDDVVVVRAADLSITKTPSATTVVAGDDDGVTYTLVVENAGPSVAAATTVVDTLPAALVPVSASSTVGTCRIDGQEVSCDLGDLLEADGPVTVTVEARVRSGVADGTTVTNTATVSSTTPDVDGTGPTTDSDDATITVDTEATLTVTKTATSTTVRAGETIAYTLVVHDDGPSDVPGPVTVTDTLPTGLTFDSASTTGSPAWVCDDDGQEVTCTLGDGTAGLVAGASAPTLRLVAVVAAAAEPGTVTNTAYATSTLSGDSDPDTADVDVTTSADLGLTKTHTGTAVAGEPFAWTLTVTNGGPSDSRATAADPIVVRDTLPVGVTFDDSHPVTGGGFTCVAGTPVTVGGDTHEVVECTRPTTLAALATASVTVPVLLDGDLHGTVTNRAVVTPSGLTTQPVVETLDDEATDDVTVTGVADLGLVKELVTDPADVVAGHAIAWRVAVTNHGPSTSRADATTPIVVVDELPAGVQDATASGAGWVCTTDDGTVTCERDTDLLVGATPVITVTATVRSSATGDVVNVATVRPGGTPQEHAGAGSAQTGDEPDTDDATATPSASADLRLVKSVLSEPVAGGTARYRVEVTNLGPSDARDVVVHDELPAGLTFAAVVGSSAGSWACTGTTDVTCTLDAPLPTGAMATLDLEVAVDPTLTGDVVNTATVTSSTPDPEPADNTDSVTSGTTAYAELSVVKTHTGDARVGGTLTYHLVVANAGPSAASDVTVLDQVPASLQVTAVRADDATWRCVIGEAAADGTPVLCTTASLAPGTTAPTIDIDVVVGPDAFPGVVNVVEVRSSTPGADGIVISTDDDSMALAPLVDLTLVKTFDGDALQVGSTGTFVLTVTNAGPTADPGPITVTDVLPAGLTFDTASGATCAADGQEVTCTLDGLDVGESAEVRLTVRVGAVGGTSVTNTASVTSGTEDVDTENNSGSVTVPVRGKPLATTGVETGLLAMLAMFLLAGGTAAVVQARRR